MLTSKVPTVDIIEPMAQTTGATPTKGILRSSDRNEMEGEVRRWL